MAKCIRNRLIHLLAAEGCNSNEIQKILKKQIDVELSLRQIQRLVKMYGFNKKPRQESPLQLIEMSILSELEGSGSLLGYRAMWNRLRNKHHLTVKRNTVMMLLALLDPEGSAQRKKRRLKRRVYRSKGPNYVWHCDGYDKLKPYGLPIHGCIDGYSRRVLWLEIANSNNNPLHIAHYFLTTVQNLGGCPRLLRTDLGSENSKIAFLQPMLRHYHSDSLSGCNSHCYGKSTSNQRIEAFWSQLRRHFMEWWIDFFKEMIFEGHFNPAIPFHVDTVRYTFGSLIREELGRFVTDWNTHKIRQSKMAETPGGVPNLLFNFPDLQGCRDYMCSVSDSDITILSQYSKVPSLTSETYENLAKALQLQYNLPSPSNFNSALKLYFCLVQLIDQVVEQI